MQRPPSIPIVHLVVVLISVFSFQFSAFPQSTAFTYQGRLNDGTNPANGSYDLTFALFDQASGGTQQGAAITNTATSVTGGLITVTLDFGSQFPGAPRWLEAGVRTNGGGAFATLSPRQQLTSAPYAVRSLAAGAAASVTGSVAASQLTGTILPANIGAGSITSSMLATGSVTSAQLSGNSVSLDKLSTLMDGQVQATITDPVASANYLAAHQFGFAMSTAGSSRFIVGNPAWDSVQCNCPLCLCYLIYPDTGIVWFYNNDGSFVSGYLPPTLSTNAQFGSALADLGGKVLVGAPGVGQVWTMGYDGGVGPTPRFGSASDKFGASVAGLANGIQLIAAPYANTIYGIGYVYAYNGDTLSSGGFLRPPAPAQSGLFGFAMAPVSASRILVGSPQAFSVGTAYLFDVDIISMTTGAVLVTSFTNPAGGGAGFGVSMVGVGGNRVLIGAPSNPGGGAAYLYSTNGSLLTTFANPDPASGDGFGGSLALFGPDKLLVGAALKTVGGVSGAGVAYVFNTNGTWLGVLHNPSPQANTHFGYALLGLDTNHVVATAFDLPNQGSLGSARIFTFDGPKYVPGLSVQPGENVALLNANQTFTGNPVFTGTPSFSNQVNIAGHNVMDFGAGLPGQEPNAGKIGYEVFSPDALDIVGAGTNGFSRKIQFYAEAGANFNGPVNAPVFSANQLIASNNIGIGTSSPIWPLNFANTTGEKISLYNSSGTNSYGFGIQGFQMQLHTDTPAADIVFGSGPSTNMTETMRIKGIGNVGIGTAAPGKALQIGHGNNPVDGLIRLGCGTGTGIGRTWDIGVPYGGNDTTGTNYSFMIADQGASPSPAARLMIDWNTGNVGIGLTNPTNKLHVAGGVSATAFVQTSDRHAKENFAPVSPQEVLSKVATLPITTWNFKEMKDGRHMGPMAQDFYAAFGLGGGETTITGVDPDGVALAAIQGLNEKVEDRSQRAGVRIQKLEDENAQLNARLEKLERLMNDKQNGGAR